MTSCGFERMQRWRQEFTVVPPISEELDKDIKGKLLPDLANRVVIRETDIAYYVAFSEDPEELIPNIEGGMPYANIMVFTESMTPYNVALTIIRLVTNIRKQPKWD